MHVCVCAKSLQLCLTLCDPMNHSPQAPLSMEFSRQEYWSGLPCLPSRGNNEVGCLLHDKLLVLTWTKPSKTMHLGPIGWMKNGAQAWLCFQTLYTLIKIPRLQKLLRTLSVRYLIFISSKLKILRQCIKTYLTLLFKFKKEKYNVCWN